MTKQVILISACLIGRHTRYDGSRKYVKPPASWPEAITVFSVCPEVEMGLGIPREPMRLVSRSSIQLETCTTKINQTKKFETWLSCWENRFPYSRIHGAILKEKSPSCGLQTPLYDAKGKIIAYTTGLFALFLQKQFAEILLQTEEVFKDISVWQKFIDQINKLA